MPDQETEITLGNGRLLGLFIGLVVLCGVFFVMGYMLGKNSAPGNTLLTETPSTSPADTAVKPAAVTGVAAPVAAPAPAPQPAAEAANEAQPEAAPATAVTATESPRAAAPEVAKPAVPSAAANYMVQVAAVSKQQDAEALAAALRRKQYAVFVANHAPDNLFHVQIGPFTDSKQAEAVRVRLVADGYNPIVKK